MAGNGQCQTVINHCKIILTIISCPVPPHLVHGMLWHSLDLQRRWLCISYFYIPNVSGVDLRTDILCSYDQCAVAIWGFPLGYPPPVIPTLLKMRTGDALAPHFHQLTTLSIVVRTKSLLVQRQSPVSHSYTVDDVFSSKIADTVQIWPHKTLQSYRKSYMHTTFLTTAYAYV